MSIYTFRDTLRFQLNLYNFNRYFQVCELLKEDGEFKVKIYTHEVNNTMIMGHRFISISWKLDM